MSNFENVEKSQKRKMSKNRENHEFSILDKSADLADINDLQIR